MAAVHLAWKTNIPAGRGRSPAEKVKIDRLYQFHGYDVT
jgi:hypothetical protein